MLRNIPRMTISSDIWTKRGQTSSYLGVTSTFYHPKLERKVNVVLGVQQFETVTHNADDIVREMRKVLAKFGIQPQQVFRAMTDGASNMICSHRKENEIFVREEQCERRLEEEYDSMDSEPEVTSERQSTLIGAVADSESSIIENSMNPCYRR
ncbi:unnamed protein product, partial [Allacma fusca]